MLEQINEPIEVIVKFARDQVVPVKFLWQTKEYLVKKVNLVYSRSEGKTKFYFFAVSDNANYFKLQLNSDTLSWTLLETYVE